MTSHTIQQARDIMLALLYDGIKANGYTEDFRIFFEDDDNDDGSGNRNVSATETWIEIIIRHTRSAQNTLQGSAGNKRFQRNGNVVVNVHTPFGDGMKTNDNVSEIICEILENSSTSIWFRNTNPAELGRYRSWFLTSITSEFEYDQIR